MPGSVAAEWTIPAEHPRLLLNRERVAALRVQAGIDRYQDDPLTGRLGLRFGGQRDEFERLLAVADEILIARPRSDDLWVPALLHLIAGELGQSDRYTTYVARSLLLPDVSRLELDHIIALDWCWDAIEPELRQRIIARAVAGMDAFEPTDNPMNAYRFERKLCGLATALTLFDARQSTDTPQAAAVQTALKLAQAYLEGPFAKFAEERGAMPSSGSNGVWEEAGMVLAVELWRSGAGRSLWPRLADSLGRSMEHYFYADTQYRGLEHGFIHDDGSHIPPRPGEVYRGFVPAVPGAIAWNLKDPIATWYARRSLSSASPDRPAEIERYVWTRLLYGPLEQPEAVRRGCPLGRNFGGGWVAMRTGWERGETVVLFDVGQPFWRSRQHYDAGQFQIYRKGRLAIDSGDDVTFEAVPARGGNATIAGERADWDEYYQATIAHNCVTVADRMLSMESFSRSWPAMGGQRTIGRTYDLSEEGIHSTERTTGTLIAFQSHERFCWAVADLTQAYPAGVVRAIQRRILLDKSGIMIVLDRLRTVKLRSVKTWHLQLPERPRLNRDVPLGRRAITTTGPDLGPWDLSHARQLHGMDALAGIWELWPGEDWINVSAGHGRLFVRTLLPQTSRRRIMGGPMQARQIPTGPYAGQSYVGGGTMGYEHRLWPATILHGPNAAYTLGVPETLGPQFGVGTTWGRFEVAPLDDTDQVTFLHLMYITDSPMTHPPAVQFEQAADQAVILVEPVEVRLRIELNLTDGPPGQITATDPTRGVELVRAALAESVEPPASIPLSQSADPLR